MRSRCSGMPASFTITMQIAQPFFAASALPAVTIWFASSSVKHGLLRIYLFNEVARRPPLVAVGHHGQRLHRARLVLKRRLELHHRVIAVRRAGQRFRERQVLLLA